MERLSKATNTCAGKLQCHLCWWGGEGTARLATHQLAVWRKHTTLYFASLRSSLQGRRRCASCQAGPARHRQRVLSHPQHRKHDSHLTNRNTQQGKESMQERPWQCLQSVSDQLLYLSWGEGGRHCQAINATSPPTVTAPPPVSPVYLNLQDRSRDTQESKESMQAGMPMQHVTKHMNVASEGHCQALTMFTGSWPTS